MPNKASYAIFRLNQFLHSQVPDGLKDNVPESVKEKAREMARQELERRLKELDMSMGEAKEYEGLLAATQTHVLSLHDFLERQFSFALPSCGLTVRNKKTLPRKRRKECG